MTHIIKYPRTPHLEGSCLQAGDQKQRVLLSELADGLLVWEEKLDGANCGISFSNQGALQLQSRGHFLMGGARERQFDILKSWAQAIAAQLWPILGTRYIMFGEWLYAKHSIFYNALPHYFFEFDILDTETRQFLSTERRHDMLQNTPVHSVPVVKTGPAKKVVDIEKALAPSLYKTSAWRDRLSQIAKANRICPDQALLETDDSDLSEGFYFKLERDGQVIGRYKFVRSEFLQTILQSGSHWNERPLLPNQLADGVDIFADLNLEV